MATNPTTTKRPPPLILNSSTSVGAQGSHEQTGRMSTGQTVKMGGDPLPVSPSTENRESSVVDVKKMRVEKVPEEKTLSFEEFIELFFTKTNPLLLQADISRDKVCRALLTKFDVLGRMDYKDLFSEGKADLRFLKIQEKIRDSLPKNPEAPGKFDYPNATEIGTLAVAVYNRLKEFQKKLQVFQQKNPLTEEDYTKLKEILYDFGIIKSKSSAEVPVSNIGELPIRFASVVESGGEAFFLPTIQREFIRKEDIDNSSKTPVEELPNGASFYRYHHSGNYYQVKQSAYPIKTILHGEGLLMQGDDGLYSSFNIAFGEQLLSQEKDIYIIDADEKLFRVKASRVCRDAYALIKKEKPSPLLGIPNASGVDCFMNAAMQILDQGFYEVLNCSINPIDRDKIKAALFSKEAGSSRLDYREFFPGEEAPEGQEAYFDIQARLSDFLKEEGAKCPGEDDIEILIDCVEEVLKDLQDVIIEFLEELREGPIEAQSVMDLRERLYLSAMITSLEEQECSAGFITKVVDPFIRLSEGGKRFLTEEHKAFYISDADAVEREEIDEIPDSESCYKEEDYQGNKVYAIHRRRTDSFFGFSPPIQDTQYPTGDSFLKGSDDYEDYKDGSVRYIKDASGKMFKVKAKGLHSYSEQRILPETDTLIVNLSRMTGADLIAFGILEEGQPLPKAEFPASFTANGKEFVLTGAILHEGQSQNAGHYIAVRLVKDEQNQNWSWHVFNDSKTEILSCGNFKDLSEVVLPRGVATGHDIGGLLQAKSNLLMYREKASFAAEKRDFEEED